MVKVVMFLIRMDVCYFNKTW